MHPAIIIGTVRSLMYGAMGQIPRSTERISSLFYSRLHHVTVTLRINGNYRSTFFLHGVCMLRGCIYGECALGVCGSTRTRGYTRTRPVPVGMGRVWVDVLRVGSGTGTKSTGRVYPFYP